MLETTKTETRCPSCAATTEALGVCGRCCQADLLVRATIMTSKVAHVAGECYAAYVVGDYLEVARLRTKMAGGMSQAVKLMLEADSASPHPTYKKLAADIAKGHEATGNPAMRVPELKSMAVVLARRVGKAAGVVQ